jgi:signal peptidase
LILIGNKGLREYGPQQAEDRPEDGGRPPESRFSGLIPRAPRVLSAIRDALFFPLLLGILAAGLLCGARGGLFGFSVYTVLSGSMQRELPQGSLIVVRQTDPAQIQIGDDITFYSDIPAGADTETTVTHRVVRVLEGYAGGERGFETRGLENPLPDRTIVRAGDVVGRVAFHLPGIGGALFFIKGRWYLIAALLVCLAVSLVYRRPSPTKRGETG